MSKQKKEEKKAVGPGVEAVEYREITFTCPTRGKVTQKVKVTKYKAQQVEQKDFVKSSDPVINDFDMSEITGSDIDDDDLLTGVSDD